MTLEFTTTIEGVPEVRSMLENTFMDVRYGAVRAVEGAIKVGAETARSEHKFKTKTGFLLSHTTHKMVREDPSNPLGEIIADARYASFINNGTRPHRIGPRTGGSTPILPYSGGGRHTHKVLAWQEPEGEWHFARGVNHPGTQPDPFMDRAGFAAAIELQLLMQAVVDEACAKANK